MGNPIQTIPNLPPAIGLSGDEQTWINQAGVDRRTSLSAIAALVVVPPPNGGGGGVVDGSAAVVTAYSAIRKATFPATVTSVVLNDIYKGGVFVRGPASLPDNGGTRIKDASGQFWWRVYDERINAAWFYSGPPDTLGNPTTLGSGPAQITQADLDANIAVWVGLADDGYGGGPGSVQTAQPYPVGTYWDFVALQEWIYACAAERSVPQSTFIGAMNNDGRLRVSQWLTGPGFLGIGQPITGAGVAPGSFVSALDPDPNVYWIGLNHYTGSLHGVTTDAGTNFDGYLEGVILTANGIYTNPGAPPLLKPGDEITSPLYPPESFFNGVLPGTTVGPQIDGPPGGAVGVRADFYIGIKQNVPSTLMVGVGGPTWNTVGGEYQRNIPGFCPRGVMYLNQMLVVNGNGLDLLFASKRGTTLNWYGNATATSNVGPGIKFNTLAYSTVKSLTVFDQSVVLGGVSNYLVSLSHTPGTPGLNVENNTLQDWNIVGNYNTSQAGIAISPEGGAAQGDTQMFIQCWVTGFYDGFTFGGANAIGGTFIGGQTQACPRYGVAAFGGSFSAYTMLTENNSANSYYQTPQRTQIHLGGADFYAQQVQTESCVVIGCRSEGTVGMADTNHESSVINWTTGGYFNLWAPNQHWTPQTLLAVNNPGVNSTNALNNYAVVMLADDGGPPWLKSDASSTTTVISFTPNPGWTPNQWAGFGVWLMPAGAYQANSIAIESNTANTITLPAATPAWASGANWWKIFNKSGGAAPNWGATTHFGQFLRNAAGWGSTIAAGFNLLQTATGVVAGDWVMIPDQAVFPDGGNVPMALTGKVQNQHPSSTGWYIQSFGTLATVWGVPSNPILLGGLPSATGYNFLIGQTSGAAGAIGQYTLQYPQTLGSDFTGSISGAFLTVTAVNHGAVAAGQYLGGAGISNSAPPQITNAGVGFTGFVDDGSGGTVKGTVLTVQTVAAGVIRLGAPLTGGAVAAGTVILSQISGPAGGAGTYNVSGQPQLLGQCAFTGSMTTTAQLTVTAIASGALAFGQLLQGPGVPPGCLLSTQISGVAGGVGLYNITSSVNVASEAMTATWSLAGGGLAAQFTATVDNGAGSYGNILTVTAMAGGVLGVGQTVNVPVSGGPAGMTAQATIVPSLTSTGTGGLGTYALSGLGNIIVPSSAMTANSTGGIGTYTISPPAGAPITSEAMQGGYLSQIAPLWEIVDAHGNPQNAAKSTVDANPAYYSAGITDGGLTHMVIDYDVMWGVGSLDQCQLGLTGKVGAIGRIDNLAAPGPGGITGAAIRPNEGFVGQFSYKNAAQFTLPPRFGVGANVTPFTIDASFFNQSNVVCTVAANNTVLGLAPLGPGLIVDIDLFLTPGQAISGGMIVDWDPTTVKSPTTTINIGQNGQQTIVRMKWVGNANPAAPGGHWYVMSAEGPM
jgi:hypothetical protein